ncbi:flavin reductase family protein [Vibrio sagamiensis]|uniref:Hybrid-cluster NAD(P)-dependent oxidoreductase n=1 Tax=Vibrio sagamiensis NBRC 104589 TaxID=1219064 RepID=A0A511QG15_9VIBR|nr:iron-sulfur cluster-binding domain-containing protein [Vibrio sagamiensis]GEM76249.1 hybrid-cluster NAD(P)-dependent oxidoreductase [Vibrio sagamiensis NBRC 104589]
MKVKVIAEKLETSNAKTIRFSPVDSHVMSFIPGQCCSLQVELEGKLHKRCYSFSSIPRANGTFDITVKKVNGGMVSKHLVETNLVGQEFEVSQAFGEFNEEKLTSAKSIVFLAAGSGITPIYSMLKSLNANSTVSVTLLYYNRSRNDVIFYDQLKAFGRDQENVTVHLFSSEFPTCDMYHDKISPMSIKRLCPDIATSSVSICGPSGFMDSAQRFVSRLGVNESCIHREFFTNLVLEDKSTTKDAQDEKVEVQFLCAKKSVRASKGALLLDVIKDNNIALRSECCIGSCGVCKIKLKKGSVKMNHIGGLNPVDENNNYILACCSKLTGNLTVDLDESSGFTKGGVES